MSMPNARSHMGIDTSPDTFSIAKNIGDKRFLSWLADRLVSVYGESEQIDFVQTLRQFAAAFEPPAERGLAAGARETDEETARNVADLIVNRFLDLGMMSVVPQLERDLVRDRILAALATARASERERCKTLAVKPMDLPNLIRDAFLAGRGLKDGDKLSTEDQAAWMEYDPERVPAYGRLFAAIHGRPPAAIREDKKEG